MAFFHTGVGAHTMTQLTVCKQEWHARFMHFSMRHSSIAVAE